jgi:hypothetical protein
VFGAGAALGWGFGGPWGGEADDRPQLPVDLDQGSGGIDLRRSAGGIQQFEELVDSFASRLDPERVLATGPLLGNWIELDGFEVEHG